MSYDFYLVCHECRQRIHLAQDGLSGWTFYSGETDCMAKFSEFLDKHALDLRGHQFVLHGEDVQSSQDYETIEWAANHNAGATP